MELLQVKIGAKEGLNMPEVLVELAAKEWEAMELIKGDLCQWLASVLQLEATPASFLDALDSGVEVCELAGLIQQAALQAKEKGLSFSFQVPMEELNFSTKACSGGSNSSFYARDNVSNFISWCRGLGVQEAVMFESEGLVLHKDEKRVILCLLDVARFAERVGIAPPQLVRMEREIEALEGIGGVTLHEGTLKKEPPKVQSTTGEVPSPDPSYRKNTCHELLPFPSKPDVLLSSNSKRGHASRIPVRKSRRLVNRTPDPLPIATGGKSWKRARRSDEGDQLPAPSQKRRRVEGEGGSVKRHRVIDGREEEAGDARGRGVGNEKGRVFRGKKARVIDGEGLKEAKESLDESIMKKMAECTCQNKIEVTNCGNGKFIVKGASGKTMTTYARVRSCRGRGPRQNFWPCIIQRTFNVVISKNCPPPPPQKTTTTQQHYNRKKTTNKNIPFT